MEILNLIFEPCNWSWGLIVKHIQESLGKEFEVETREYYSWCKKPQSRGLILSQNVTQLPHIPWPRKTISRLGGNMSFTDARAPVFLDLISKCAAVVATNSYLEKIGLSVNAHTTLIPNGLNLDTWKAKRVVNGE